jgi:hypothetical protein
MTRAPDGRVIPEHDAGICREHRRQGPTSPQQSLTTMESHPVDLQPESGKH